MNLLSFCFYVISLFCLHFSKIVLLDIRFLVGTFFSFSIFFVLRSQLLILLVFPCMWWDTFLLLFPIFYLCLCLSTFCLWCAWIWISLWLSKFVEPLRYTGWCFTSNWDVFSHYFFIYFCSFLFFPLLHVSPFHISWCT